MRTNVGVVHKELTSYLVVSAITYILSSVWLYKGAVDPVNRQKRLDTTELSCIFFLFLKKKIKIKNTVTFVDSQVIEFHWWGSFLPGDSFGEKNRRVDVLPLVFGHSLSLTNPVHSVQAIGRQARPSDSIHVEATSNFVTPALRVSCFRDEKSTSPTRGKSLTK